MEKSVRITVDKVLKTMKSYDILKVVVNNHFWIASAKDKINKSEYADFFQEAYFNEVLDIIIEKFVYYTEYKVYIWSDSIHQKLLMYEEDWYNSHYVRTYKRADTAYVDTDLMKKRKDYKEKEGKENDSKVQASV